MNSEKYSEIKTTPILPAQVDDNHSAHEGHHGAIPSGRPIEIIIETT